MALCKPGDTVMGMKLAHGGHLTHGSPVNFSGQYFNIVGYGVNEQGYIDYDEVERLAMEHKPKLIICGASAYPRVIDFKRFREIADKCGAFLMSDIAHIAVHMKQHKIFEFFLRSERIAHPDGVLGFALGEVARRHGEVLGGEQPGNGVTGDDPIQPGFFVGLLTGGFQLLTPFFQFGFLCGQRHRSLCHLAGQGLDAHIQLLFGFGKLLLLFC